MALYKALAVLTHTCVCVTMLLYFFTESVGINYFLIVLAFGVMYIIGYLAGKLAGWLGISNDRFNDFR